MLTPAEKIARSTQHIRQSTGLTLLILQQTQERLAALQIRMAARK